MDMRDGLPGEIDELADAPAPGGDEPLFDLGGDERRMHVRAYNHWVSLLKGRPYPSIEDLEPANIADFGEHSVLLDFAGDVTDPGIAFLGRTLREECGLTGGITKVAEVPSRSLLSRLTDHYLQIIANRAPIGFEAEFVGTRGRATMYRGILMPFSSPGGEGIDYIYGVINWKEVADPAVQATLGAELDAALREAPRDAGAPIWADGPGSGEDDQAPIAPAGSLADTLMLARETAAAVRAADTRSRAALYRALGRAHDFGLAADADEGAYRALLEDHGIAVQARAPLTPVVKLVFGVDYDKTRVTEFAAVLGHARRHGITGGRLPQFLDGFEGGIKAIVAAERQARKPVSPDADSAPAVSEQPVLARVEMETSAQVGDSVVLVARVGEDGALEVIHQVADAKLAARVMRAGR